VIGFNSIQNQKKNKKKTKTKEKTHPMTKIGGTEHDLDARKRRNELFTSPPIRPSPITVATSQQDFAGTQDGQQIEEPNPSRCELLRLSSQKEDEIREKIASLSELNRQKEELEALAVNS
jgi:hypothetical protein